MQAAPEGARAEKKPPEEAMLAQERKEVTEVRSPLVALGAGAKTKAILVATGVDEEQVVVALLEVRAGKEGATGSLTRSPLATKLHGLQREEEKIEKEEKAKQEEGKKRCRQGLTKRQKGKGKHEVPSEVEGSALAQTKSR